MLAGQSVSQPASQSVNPAACHRNTSNVCESRTQVSHAR
jgi:hypothetical protein